ncbi:MAG TPA: hypothetical protein VF094_11405 [Gaiellaceae bacterium]
MSAEGNARLTAATAAVLLVLLAAEGATIPFVGQVTTLHIFLGVLLVPVVLLKAGSSAWRFASYYFGREDYVSRGAPPPLLRLLVAPLVVASTAVLFGTGILLIVPSPQRGAVLGLHQASFLVWFAAMTAHVLAHVLRVPGLVREDLRPGQRGATTRQLLVAGAVVAGLVTAVALLPEAHGWSHWALTHGDG